jgi:hypothetical protein
LLYIRTLFISFMQQTFTDKGLAIARILIAFSMFPMVLNPLKYSWVMILPSLMMLYFSFKKYKEEKSIGIEGSKYGVLAIMTSVTTIAFVVITIVNYMDLYDYLD